MRRLLTGVLVLALAAAALRSDSSNAQAQALSQSGATCGNVLGGEYAAETAGADVIDLTVRYAQLCRTTLTAITIDLDQDGHPDLVAIASGLFGIWRVYGIAGASVVADTTANTLRWRIPLPAGTFDAHAAFAVTAWAPGGTPDRVPNSGEFVWPPADSFED